MREREGEREGGKELLAAFPLGPSQLPCCLTCIMTEVGADYCQAVCHGTTQWCETCGPPGESGGILKQCYLMVSCVYAGLFVSEHPAAGPDGVF